MSLSDLPALNACLNGASTIFLALGYYFIKRGRQIPHRNCMIGALATSALFLTSYLVYHYHAGRTVFVEPRWFRPIYLTLLLTHTVLAVAIVPLVLMTVIRAYRANAVSPLPFGGEGVSPSQIRAPWQPHRRMARWTLPIWLYVSITGVLIYFLLYQIFPQK
jgi:putative membrane protein